jgi:hypothetical protein
MLNFKTEFFINFSDRLTDLEKNKRISKSYSRSDSGQRSVKCRSEENYLTGRFSSSGQVRSNPVKSGQFRSDNLTVLYISVLTAVRSNAGQMPVKSILNLTGFISLNIM